MSRNRVVRERRGAGRPLRDGTPLGAIGRARENLPDQLRQCRKRRSRRAEMIESSLHEVAKRSSFDKGHCKELPAITFPRNVNRYDVRLMQAGQGVLLALEP